MTLSGFLPLIVCIFGLVIWLIFGPTAPPPAAAQSHRGIVADAGRIAYAMGLLAFLLGAGAVMESCSTATGGPVLREHHSMREPVTHQRFASIASSRRLTMKRISASCRLMT